MSSSSESDEEYVPGEPEVVSEEESADEETEQQYENEQEVKAQKRKASTKKKGNKRCKSKTVEEKDELEVKADETNPEAEKKREDDLWAMFLDGTETKPKSKETATTATAKDAPKTTNLPQTSISTKKEDTDRERRIFEFAGETIVVENNVIKEKFKAGEGPADVKKLEAPVRARSSGGLAGVLGQLNKKSQLSTLDKSKLDWETLKKTEGVEDEIQSHNKGKKGYLDRQDFLQRADLRQYELERDARLGRRSNR